MEQVFELLSVIGLAAIELWAAVPAGLALGLNPFLVGIGAAAGAMIGTVVVVLVGRRLRNWLVRRHRAKNENQRAGPIQRIWKRYGLVGLGVLAPLLTGAPLGAALGISLGANPRRLMVWMSLGIVVWTTILTAAVFLGWAGLKKAF